MYAICFRNEIEDGEKKLYIVVDLSVAHVIDNTRLLPYNGKHRHFNITTKQECPQTLYSTKLNLRKLIIITLLYTVFVDH